MWGNENISEVACLKTHIYFGKSGLRSRFTVCGTRWLVRTWSLLQKFPTSDTSLSFIFITKWKRRETVPRLPRVLVTVNHLQLAFLEEQLTFSFHFIYLFVCRRVPSAYKQRVGGCGAGPRLNSPASGIWVAGLSSRVPSWRLDWCVKYSFAHHAASGASFLRWAKPEVRHRKYSESQGVVGNVLPLFICLAWFGATHWPFFLSEGIKLILVYVWKVNA